jgi:hypothetical protein
MFAGKTENIADGLATERVMKGINLIDQHAVDHLCERIDPRIRGFERKSFKPSDIEMKE